MYWLTYWFPVVFFFCQRLTEAVCTFSHTIALACCTLTSCYINNWLPRTPILYCQNIHVECSLIFNCGYKWILSSLNCALFAPGSKNQAKFLIGVFRSHGVSPKPLGDITREQHWLNILILCTIFKNATSKHVWKCLKCEANWNNCKVYHHEIVNLWNWFDLQIALTS